MRTGVNTRCEVLKGFASDGIDNWKQKYVWEQRENLSLEVTVDIEEKTKGWHCRDLRLSLQTLLGWPRMTSRAYPKCLSLTSSSQCWFSPNRFYYACSHRKYHKLNVLHIFQRWKTYVFKTSWGCGNITRFPFQTSGIYRSQAIAVAIMIWWWRNLVKVLKNRYLFVKACQVLEM